MRLFRILRWNIKVWWDRKFGRCEWCRNKLKKGKNYYYGGIDVPDNIKGDVKTTYYVCNLCYAVLKKILYGKN